MSELSRTESPKIKTTTWQKPIGYCSPIKNHNIGRQQAAQTRKNYTVNDSCCSK